MTASTGSRTLLVGFDSAWTEGNRGAIVGVLRSRHGRLTDLGTPQLVRFPEAAKRIQAWQVEHEPNRTVIMIDQPTIVPNSSGQRPVESLVSSVIGRRRSAVQPANTGRTAMFGAGAPVWGFLEEFRGAAHPDALLGTTAVFETYPGLALIALGWLTEERCLPKYNPGRRRAFRIQDWRFVCTRAAAECRKWGVPAVSEWLDGAASIDKPRKPDQDMVDSCICLLAGLHLAGGKESLMVGNMASGYMVVPYDKRLCQELEARCLLTRRNPSEWVQMIRRSVT